jgi:hypothetical protein
MIARTKGARPMGLSPADVPQHESQKDSANGTSSTEPFRCVWKLRQKPVDVPARRNY